MQNVQCLLALLQHLLINLDQRIRPSKRLVGLICCIVTLALQLLQLMLGLAAQLLAQLVDFRVFWVHVGDLLPSVH